MAQQMNSDKGYVIALAEDSDFYIAGALHIERDDSLIPWKFNDDTEAAKAAEQMSGVRDTICR